MAAGAGAAGAALAAGAAGTVRAGPGWAGLAGADGADATGVDLTGDGADGLVPLGAGAAGRCGAEGDALVPPGALGAGLAAVAVSPPERSSAGNCSLILRTTGGSMVELADRTNSPWLFKCARRALLSSPSSFASS